jgi:hypothetical protein
MPNEAKQPLTVGGGEKVTKQKRARGFMVNQKATGAPLLRALFDARVLHVVRRASADAPEEGTAMLTTGMASRRQP